MILETAMFGKSSDLMLTKTTNQILSQLRHVTKRFVFDAAASACHGNFSVTCADIVCQQSQFAITPYPNTYIEIDNISSINQFQTPYTDAAKRLGFWFVETGDIYCISGDEKNAMFTPFVYHHVKDNIEGLPADYDVLKKHLLVGQVSDDLKVDVDRFSTRITDIWDFSLIKDIPREMFEKMVYECAGTLKRALASVLLLNQRKEVRLTDVGPRRKIVGGRMRTYGAHSVVSIDISNDPITLRRLARGTEIHMRRHEVRGHFVHYDVSTSCDHEWLTYKNETQSKRDMDRAGHDIARWGCKHCGGRRVFKESHYRGDAGLGYVSKSYEVTDRK
jgi:hypothetical protein